MHIFRTVFCCCLLFILSSSRLTERIKVDHENHQSFNISSIAEKSIPIKIKKDVFNVKHLAVSDEFLFLAVGTAASKGFPRSIQKFDRKGNYIKEIFRINKQHIRGIAYDKENRHVFISYDNQILVFGPDDKLLKTIPVRNSGDIIFYNGKIYMESREGNQYKALELDPETGDIKKIIQKEVINESMPAGISIGRIGSFSISGGGVIYFCRRG